MIRRGSPGSSGAAPDPQAAHARLQAVGIEGEKPLDFTRPVETDAGTYDASFTVLHLPRIGFDGCRSFFCHHKTPELVWRPEWQDHANGVQDITEFYFAGDDPKAALGMFERVFGPGIVSPAAGGFAFQAAEARITALSLEAARERFGAAAPIPEPGPARMIALGVRTTSLEKARAALAAGGVGFDDLGGRLRVGQAEAFGLAIEFHE